MIRAATALNGWLCRPDIAIFHEFHRPPYGGANQFLIALDGELRRRRHRVEVNYLSRSARACLFNSYNFDVDELRRARRPGCRMVHRVDGPIDVYRGTDGTVDRLIHGINAELADATVVQSRYSLEQHGALGIEFRAPVIVPNAADPAIFHPPPLRHLAAGRKVRLISTSWSPNPGKGAEIYRNIEQRLDWDRFQYTFLGNAAVRFARIRMVPPLDSGGVAGALRGHDIYVTASAHDPCSNALVEALSCGLPAVYRNSGGHPELVRAGGLPFDDAAGAVEAIEAVARDYDGFAARVTAPHLTEVAGQYLTALGFVR